MGLAETQDSAYNETINQIGQLGLTDNLLELDTVGYTTLRGVLTSDQVERARKAILNVMERKLERDIDLDGEDSDDLNGVSLASYLLFEDPVFEEIVQASRPLSMIHYLLGRSALLSSMTCHFKASGGAPLALHSDNGNGITAPYSMVSQVANVNYALTEYSKEKGALAMVPGSHRFCRSPHPFETMLGGEHGNPNAVAMDLRPGDCVVWHGNTWHGSFVRQVPGIRMNLAVYFCRQYIVTQEKFNEYVPEEFLNRHANNSRLLTLLGQKQAYGWDAEGPNWDKFARAPRGQFD